MKIVEWKNGFIRVDEIRYVQRHNSSQGFKSYYLTINFVRTSSPFASSYIVTFDSSEERDDLYNRIKEAM